jgi:hypothetical protein
METHTVKSIPYKVRQLLELPLWTFWISFGIASLLLAFYLTGSSTDAIGRIGFWVIILTLLCNAIIAIVIITCSFAYPVHQAMILQRGTIILLNIPIALLYFFIMIANFTII